MMLPLLELRILVALSCMALTAFSITFPPCAAIEALRGSSLPVNRSLFYIPPDVTYLNSATLGPMARPCLECAVEAWEALEADPHNNYPWEKDSVLDSVRRHAADMLGCLVDELAFVPSTTVALELIGEGLVATGYIRPTDFVLTTDQEHPGGLAVWNHWVNMDMLGGVDHVALPIGDEMTNDEILHAFRKMVQEAQAIGKHYRVVSVSHVLTTTGARLPLQELAQLAHEADALLLVDGAQGPGNIAVQLHESGADAYTVSAHKWLLAPTGSGLLYVKKSAQEVIQPAQLARGYQAYSENAGTVPLQTIAGLGYALDLFDAYGGLDAAEAHGLEMARKTRAAMIGVPGVAVISPPPGCGAETSIVTIALPPSVSNTKVTKHLKSDFGVVVKQLRDFEGGAPLLVNCIRVSHHVYTSESDVIRFVDGLKTILRDSLDEL